MATEEQLKKLEKQSRDIQIKAMIENWKNIPGIPEDIKKSIEDNLPSFLPAIKEFVKARLHDMYQHLGTGQDKKIYLLQNGKQGPTLYIWKNMVVTAGEKQMAFPIEKLVEKIDKYDKIETLITDILTLNILNVEETK